MFEDIMSTAIIIIIFLSNYRTIARMVYDFVHRGKKIKKSLFARKIRDNFYSLLPTIFLIDSLIDIIKIKGGNAITFLQEKDFGITMLILTVLFILIWMLKRNIEKKDLRNKYEKKFENIWFFLDYEVTLFFIFMVDLFLGIIYLIG